MKLYNFKEYINESNDERERSETWSLEYATLILYFHKFGLNKLGIKDEGELAEIMNTSIGSIQKHERNIVSLDRDFSDSGLSHVGNYFEIDYYKYGNYSELKLREICLEILDSMENGMTNVDFLKINKTRNDIPKLSLDDKKIIKTEFIENKSKLKTEFKEIIQNYDFKEDEKVTLHLKKSKEDPFDIIITRIDNGKIFYNRLDRNLGFEFGPLNKILYDIIYPHNLDPKYINIKID